MAVMLSRHTGGPALQLAAFCVMACFFFYGALAQTSGDCSSSLILLQPCYGYIGAGNVTKPGNDCCSPLISVFQANASCLCQIAPMAQQLGIAVNQTRALQIATDCNQTVPQDVIACLSSLSPAGAPSATPGGSTNPTPPSGMEGSYANAIVQPLVLVSIFAALLLQVLI